MGNIDTSRGQEGFIFGAPFTNMDHITLIPAWLTNHMPSKV